MSQRIVLPDYPHHVCQRGVRKEPTFQDDSDYLVYIRLLKNACNKHGVDIWSYALMTNHYHLVAVPKTEESISKALHGTHSEYSTYFNIKYDFSGHLFEKRPHISAMDYEHSRNAVRYVERNPVRAGMVERAEQYLWSSAAAHCGLRGDSLLSSNCPLTEVIQNWSDWVSIEQSEQERKTIRDHTFRGTVMFSPEVLLQIEKTLGRRLSPRKPGRPKKSAENVENTGQTRELEFPSNDKNSK